MSQSFGRIDDIYKVLKVGTFRISQLGTFTVKSFPQRKIKHPAKGYIVMIPARKVLKFTQSAQVKRMLKEI